MRITDNRQQTTDSRPVSSVSNRRGFTLIEIMVAVSIFTIVMLMATGALLSILDSNRKVQSQQAIFSNLDFALESMSRKIRVGATYRCIPGGYSSTNIDKIQDCNVGGDAFAFEPFGGDQSNPSDQIVYRLNSNQIERSTDGGASFVALTSPEIRIEGLKFYVRGSTPSDSEQPVVLISVYGCAGLKASEACSSPATKTKVDFNLQTTVTQRLLDI